MAVADVKIIEKEEVPLWIIILAVIGGLLLLCILVIVLWKVSTYVGSIYKYRVNCNCDVLSFTYCCCHHLVKQYDYSNLSIL